MPVFSQLRALELTLPAGQRCWDEDIVNASLVCRSLRELLRRLTTVYRWSYNTLVGAVERAANRRNALELVLDWKMRLGSMRTAFRLRIPSSQWYRDRDSIRSNPQPMDQAAILWYGIDSSSSDGELI